ncbi:MAG: hypothetical protein VX871_05900, partial [Pseudomonadota bacterium]|nr:hypothetical protein [Pseudomonadota bacterium]
STLAEISQKLNMSYREIESIDRQGKSPDGKDVENIPGQGDVLSEAFGSAQGIEIDPVDTADQGFVWVNVLGITPSRQKSLEEVKSQVIEDWKAEEAREALSKLSQDIIDRVRKGETLDKIASDLSLGVRESKPLKRNGSDADVPPSAVQQAFAMREGELGSAPLPDKGARVVFQLARVEKPSALSAEATKALGDSFGAQLEEDYVVQYVTGIRDGYGVTVNRVLFDEITGRER